MNRLHILRSVAATLAVVCSVHGWTGGICGPAAADSLAFPNEVFVLTREDLMNYNIHTLHDILQLLPGVSTWSEGDPASRCGFSIDGRSHYGMMLMINGESFYDPYTFESLYRFLPISRLRRVEVIYSGSPLFTCGCCASGAVNLVMEEGGREGPLSEADFTYGRSNRRARRLWFSTPRWRVSGAIAYDEYLQDAFELYAAYPSRKLGQYDMRSVLAEACVDAGGGQDVFFRFHRFEDTYLGTALSSAEDIRHRGFDSRIRYRRNSVALSLGQRACEVQRRSGTISSLLLTGSARMGFSLHGLAVRAFAASEHALFENRLWSVPFDPQVYRTEGGVTAGVRTGAGFVVRTGVCGGYHSEIGRYLCGEAGLSKSFGNAFSAGVMAARRLRIPSARELYQPELNVTWEGVDLATSGNTGLGPELSHELSLGGGYADIFFLDVFYREEKSRIILTGSGPAIYRSEGSGEVGGARGRLGRIGNVYGFGYGLNVDAEVFERRSSWTNAIPEYRILGGASVRRGIFKETEILAIRWDMEVVGKRSWDGTEMGRYTVHNLSASLTLLDAVVRAQMKNIFDEQYETVPGYLMPRRYYQIGVYWKFLD